MKQVIAGAKTAKDAGDKAECDHIMRHLKLKWHPGMSLIVPAFARPHLSYDLFCFVSLLWATENLSHDDVLWCRCR